MFRQQALSLPNGRQTRKAIHNQNILCQVWSQNKDIAGDSLRAPSHCRDGLSKALGHSNPPFETLSPWTAQKTIQVFGKYFLRAYHVLQWVSLGDKNGMFRGQKGAPMAETHWRWKKGVGEG